MWFILTVSILDFLRGRDWRIVPKPVLYFLMGASFSIYHILNGMGFQSASMLGLISFLWLWLGYSVGWGKYFASFTGKYNPKEKEFLPADFVADKIWFKTQNAYLAGTVGMCIRHVLFYPLMLAISFLTQNPLLAIVGISCVLSGLIYGLMRFVPEKYAVEIAEPLRGAFIAFLMVGI